MIRNIAVGRKMKRSATSAATIENALSHIFQFIELRLLFFQTDNVNVELLTVVAMV